MRQKKRNVPKVSHFAEEPQGPFASASEPAKPAAPTMHEHVELGAGGRLVIPAKMRAALGMAVGDRLSLRLEGSELRIYTYKEGLRRVQEMMQGLVPQGVSLVDELITERRREAAKEQADD
jgi:bifunctional DNA-binding transcriptional regulator/antitoxin component of YhaV-PrlF toxin-antitoxin module